MEHKLDEVGSALEEIGVRLKNKDETYRSMMNILGDIAEKFSTVTDETQEKVITAMCTEEIVIDENEDFDKHLDYKYIGRSIATGKLVIGYLNVDQPWYTDESRWSYMVRYQEYFGSYGHSTWKEKWVDKDSIMPYTRHNYEIYAKEIGMKIKYVTKEEFRKGLFE